MILFLMCCDFKFVSIFQKFVVYLNLNSYFFCQFVFVYQRGMAPKGDMALDDMTVVPGDCSSTPPTRPHGKNGTLQSV